MEMPQPTDAHRNLTRLAGKWSGEEKMFPSQWDPEGGVAVGRTSARVALGEFAVVTDYEQERDGQTTFSGHGVWTVDPRDRENECVLYWFDSIGMGLEAYRGGWDGDVLTVRSHTPMGQARLTYDLSEPRSIRARMENSSDGENWNLMFEATYRRED